MVHGQLQIFVVVIHQQILNLSKIHVNYFVILLNLVLLHNNIYKLSQIFYGLSHISQKIENPKFKLSIIVEYFIKYFNIR
jgi:hypothetical protein